VFNGDGNLRLQFQEVILNYMAAILDLISTQ